MMVPYVWRPSSSLVMQDFVKFLWDDMEMLKSSRAHWTLIPSAAAKSSAQQNSDSIDASQNGKRHTYGLRIAYPEEAKEICCKGLVVGSCSEADIQLDAPQVIAPFCFGNVSVQDQRLVRACRALSQCSICS